ncbi:acyl carrier protein [Aestuariibacter halophilus]|uniref:Acyl carrier protein n=1 Tax=Fluctibacter halophilus TaxID=226011 RepID=A0ABS8G4U3_9ALTE|nr:acyl carrier protein [Aestuariibacter halophilus]MCC2614880.1 acyl carrier protein [Aestuariibacter halophilus]
MALNEAALTAFLQDNMGVDPNDLDADAALFSSNLLDSFSMVELIMFIEQSADIKLNPSDIQLDNLDSINRILSFVDAAKDA